VFAGRPECGNGVTDTHGRPALGKHQGAVYTSEVSGSSSLLDGTSTGALVLYDLGEAVDLTHIHAAHDAETMTPPASRFTFVST
jgi:hypothetical protein